eukprot:UN02006
MQSPQTPQSPRDFAIANQFDKHQQYQFMNEITKLSHRVQNISRNVDFIQHSVQKVDKKVNDIEKKTQLKQQTCAKTEKIIIKMLNKLQNDVDVMKNEIYFIKQCWINSAQQYDEDEEEESDDGY